MPPNAGVKESAVLSVLVLGVAAFFALRQWNDRRRRDLELSDQDLGHFARQDRRRWAGSAVMVLLAIGLSVGTRINFRADRLHGRLFLGVWMGVATLVLVLLWLAMLDWLATRSYARRHREALANERYAVIEEERRRRAAYKNGRGKPGGPTIDPPAE